MTGQSINFDKGGDFLGLLPRAAHSAITASDLRLAKGTKGFRRGPDRLQNRIAKELGW